MDIKDFVLISGVVAIAAVLLHGFWIAWSARRAPLRLDIVPDLIPEHVDEFERLRGELPNGGARVARKPEQASFDLDEEAPLLLNTAHGGQSRKRSTAQQTLLDGVNEELFGDRLAERVQSGAATQNEPTVSAGQQQRAHAQPARPHLAAMDRTEVTREEAEPQEAEPFASEAANSGREPTVGSAPKPRDPAAATVQSVEMPEDVNLPSHAANESEDRVDDFESAPVEELLVLHVLAPRNQLFDGGSLVKALRSKGLRYGDMNIFHRRDPLSKVVLFSVANAVEPGTFDLADVGRLQSPGITLFLQLPGPGQAQERFDAMLRIAREVALQLGGEVKDEHMSALTAQTVTHYRSRIAEFSRRRLSKRA